MQTQGKRLDPADLPEATTPLLKLIANSPRLVGLYKEMTQVLVKDSVLPPHERWVITMRMAWRSHCQYEFGRKAADAPGADDLKIVTADANDPSLNETDRRLLRFTDQLYEKQNIDQALWESFRRTHSEGAMVELATLAGFYLMVSCVANTIGANPAKTAAPHATGANSR